MAGADAPLVRQGGVPASGPAGASGGPTAMPMWPAGVRIHR